MTYPEQEPLLENLHFVSPVMYLPGEDRSIRLFIQKHEGRIRFSFKSQAIGSGDAKAAWHDHFMGELLLSERKSARRCDIAALAWRLQRGVVYTSPFYLLSQVTEDGDTPFLAFGDRWDILKRSLSVPGNGWPGSS